jgi:hypothetical protein
MINEIQVKTTGVKIFRSSLSKGTELLIDVYLLILSCSPGIQYIYTYINMYIY